MISEIRGNKTDHNVSTAHRAVHSTSTSVAGRIQQVAGVLRHVIGMGALVGSLCCEVFLADCSNIRFACSIALSAVYLTSIAASRCFGKRRDVGFDAAYDARMLLRKHPLTFERVPDLSAMSQLLDEFENILYSDQTSTRLRTALYHPKWHHDLEDALYTWIESRIGSCQDVDTRLKTRKLVIQFHRFINRILSISIASEGQKASLKPIYKGRQLDDYFDLLDKIADGQGQALSLIQLHRTLRFAVYCERRSLLHSFDFGIEETLTQLRQYVRDLPNQPHRTSTLHYLDQLICSLQSLKNPPTDKLRSLWKERKTTWKTDPTEEWQRLRSVLGEKTVGYIKGMCPIDIPRPFTTVQRIITGRAMEIRDLFKDHYITLITAQSTKFWAYGVFFKELMKLQGVSPHMYHYLRYHDDLPTQPYRTAEEWAREQRVNDHEPQTRDALISADADFYNDSGNESAHSFVRSDAQGAAPGDGPITPLKNYMKNSVGLTEEVVSEVMTQLSLIAQEVHKQSECGNLYVISIPIRHAKKTFYASHQLGQPFGTPFSNGWQLAPPCTQVELRRHLTRAQVGLDGSACDQFRIAADLLSPTENPIILLSGIPNKRDAKQRIKEIAKQAWNTKCKRS